MKLFSPAWLLTLLLAATNTSNLHAQAFRLLHNFSESSWFSGMTNWDGAQPYQTGVILSGTQLYGTTYYGGANGNGTVFSVATDGSDFTVLHTFGATQPPDYTNFDGEAPQGGLVLLNDTLYGTALNGGTNRGGYGTVFALGTNGTSFAAIHSFLDIPEGSNPNGGLVVSGNKAYGTTQGHGATNGFGTVFSLNTDGTGFTVLHTFTVTATNYPYLNGDGANPYSGLVLSGDTLYGTAEYIGGEGNGTVFSVKTNGDNFTVLHTFSAGIGPYKTNVDGAFPESPVVLAGDTLYGTAVLGGAHNRGTLFSMKTNGANFRVLHTFSELADSGGYNQDGAYPEGVLFANGVIYGVTENGGTHNNGVVYAINADGSDFAVLHTFSDLSALSYWTNLDGAYPEGALVLSGNTLYGTAEQGGAGNGTLFSLKVLPTITHLTWAGTDLVLQGRNGVAGEPCTLLMSADLTLPISRWTPLATNLLTSGSFTLVATNAMDRMAPQRFYTLAVP